MSYHWSASAHLLVCIGNSFRTSFGVFSTNTCVLYIYICVCSFYDVIGMVRLYIDWMKSIRQVCKLLYRTQNSFLPHISNSVQPDILLHKRIIIFVSSGLHSENKVANFIYNLCLRVKSRMGRNVRFIALCKQNLIFNNLNLIKNWSHQIQYHWLNRDNKEGIKIRSMIFELVHQRDSFLPRLLEHHECSYIINYLCI